MLSFANAPGNYFNLVGKLGALIANIRTHQLVQLTAMTDLTTGVVGQLENESDIEAQMGSAYIGILSGVEGAAQTAIQIAASYLDRIVYRDQPNQRINQNLTTVNLQASLLELIRQMGLAQATVLAAVITATPTGFTGYGNGAVVVSVKRPSDGLVLENSFAETLEFVCTQDSYTGGATAGNETIQVTGQGSEPDIFAFDWPLGSNATLSLSAIDGNESNNAGNLLANSGFSDWTITANVPDFWTLNIGTAGTSIYQENTIVFDGSASSLAIVGDGTTQVQLNQVFNDGLLGTSTELVPLTQYAYNLFIRRDGIASGNGILTVELVDQNGNVIQDMAGAGNAFTIDLTQLTTVFMSYRISFRTPLIMPVTAYIRMVTTTPLDIGRTVYLDRTALGLMQQFYTSGPFLACFSGGDNFAAGDYAHATITNSRGAGGTLNTFQTLCDRLYGLQQQDILIPSSSTPTISDLLIS